MFGESLGRVRRRVKHTRGSRRPEPPARVERVRARRGDELARTRGIVGTRGDRRRGRRARAVPVFVPVPGAGAEDALQEVARREAVHRVAHALGLARAQRPNATRGLLRPAGLPRGLHREHLVRLEQRQPQRRQVRARGRRGAHRGSIIVRGAGAEPGGGPVAEEGRERARWLILHRQYRRGRDPCPPEPGRAPVTSPLCVESRVLTISSETNERGASWREADHETEHRTTS